LASFRSHLPYTRARFQCPIQSIQASLLHTCVSSSNARLSNGASPAALWLGHILFELPAILIVSVIITIIFGALTTQFNGIGDLFICLVLYGISSTLYSYLFALFLNSPLAAWALVAGSNVILFLLYL
jgi:ATP-binding cassette subfamily A (ABC1) protein 3